MDSPPAHAPAVWAPVISEAREMRAASLSRREGVCSEDGKAHKRFSEHLLTRKLNLNGEAVHNSTWFRCSNHEHEDGSQIITQRQAPVSPDSAQLVCPRTNGSFFFPKHFSSGAPNCLKIRSENIVWASLQQDEKLFFLIATLFPVVLFDVVWSVLIGWCRRWTTDRQR